MPGITYVGRSGHGLPSPWQAPFVMGNSQTVYGGDLMVSTSVISGVISCRPLAAADKTANYLVSSVDAGVLGIAMAPATTNSVGFAISTPPPGGINTSGQVIYPLAGIPGSLAPETISGRSQMNIALADPTMLFAGRLDSTSAAATQALLNTKAGFILTASGSETIYTIDTNAASADAIILIQGIDENDPDYGKTGGIVWFTVLGAYCQHLNGVNYTT